jgi:hypothetical protein
MPQVTVVDDQFGTDRPWRRRASTRAVTASHPRMLLGPMATTSSSPSSTLAAGHYELGAEEVVNLRVMAVFGELALAI